MPPPPTWENVATQSKESEGKLTLLCVCVGLAVVEATGEIVILLVTLLCVLLVAVVPSWRGERRTVPVDKLISLPSTTAATGLTTIFGATLLPRCMWILLSSAEAMMLALLGPFLIGVGTICFSGVTLKTARPTVISWGSGEADVSGTIDVLTVMSGTGDRGRPEEEWGVRLLSGDLALDIVVMVTGDFALSGPRGPVVDFLFWVEAE